MFWKRSPEKAPQPPSYRNRWEHHSYWEISSFLAKIMFDKRFLQPQNWSIQMAGSKKLLMVEWEAPPHFNEKLPLPLETCNRLAGPLIAAYDTLSHLERVMMSYSERRYQTDQEDGEPYILLDPSYSLYLYDYGQAGKAQDTSTSPLQNIFWKTIMDLGTNLHPSLAPLRLAHHIYTLSEATPPYDLHSDEGPTINTWVMNLIRKEEITPFRPYHLPQRIPEPLSDVISRLLIIEKDKFFPSSDDALEALTKAFRAL